MSNTTVLNGMLYFKTDWHVTVDGQTGAVEKAFNSWFSMFWSDLCEACNPYDENCICLNIICAGKIKKIKNCKSEFQRKTKSAFTPSGAHQRCLVPWFSLFALVGIYSVLWCLSNLLVRDLPEGVVSDRSMCPTLVQFLWCESNQASWRKRYSFIYIRWDTGLWVDRMEYLIDVDRWNTWWICKNIAGWWQNDNLGEGHICSP